MYAKTLSFQAARRRRKNHAAFALFMTVAILTGLYLIAAALAS